MEKNKNNETNKNFNKSSYYNEDSREIKYVFEANFDKIRNIEVEPGLIKFINGNIENNLSNNSNISGSHNLKKNNINNFENNESIKKNVNLNIIKEKEKGKHNSILKEERSIERKEDKTKTSNNSRKKNENNKSN